MHRPILKIVNASLVLAGTILASDDSFAAIFCVTSIAQLNSALNTASSNAQDDEIRIHIGQYDLSSSLIYHGNPLDSGSVSISGGWLSFPGACATQIPNAALTELNGMGTSIGLSIRTQSPTHGPVSVGNLSIVDTLSSSVAGAGGLSVTSPSDRAQSLPVDIYNVRIQQCTNASPGGCGITSWGPSQVRLRNVLVVDATSTDSYSSVGIRVRQNATGTVHLQHATVAGNSSVNYGVSGLYVENDIPVVIENAIFYGNTYSGNVPASNCDLTLRPTMTVRHSIVERLCGTPAPGQLVSVVDTNPGFASPDYRFGPGSPALDTGLAVTAIPSISKDLAGNDRVQGSLPDLGAYEGAVLPDLMLVDGFE